MTYPPDFSEFHEISLPKNEEIVYVLCFTKKSTDTPIPFYVGQSGRGTRRFADYITAQFSAPTDFKVGTVIRFLEDAKCCIRVFYRISHDKLNDEQRLIERLRKAHKLLNDVKNYAYRNADKDTERKRFETFATDLLKGG